MTSLRSLLASCMDNYDVGDKNAEWPNNMISRHALVDENGFVGRQGQVSKRPISSEEVALCQNLANEAKAVIGDVEVGMGSESGDTFHPFWLVSAQGEAVATCIDETLIRQRFGGTLFPPISMTIEPLEEAGAWWDDVVEDSGEDEQEAYLLPWQTLLHWFEHQDEFVQTAFVCIGGRLALSKLDSSTFPIGTELTPCCLPRLALGLTRQGSLCGLFGVSVQT